MNRILVLICLVHLTLAGVQAQSQNLTVWLDKVITMTADSSTVTYVKVYQTDPSEDYISFNMSIVIPKGIKVFKTKAGDEIKLSQRGTASHTIACNMPADTLIKVACISMQNQELNKIDESASEPTELFTIGLIAEREIYNGDYVMVIPASGIVFNGKSGETYVSSKITENVTATLKVVGGIETSIHSVTSQKKNGLYDMQGRKVFSKPKHGVYIEDGKKVLK